MDDKQLQAKINALSTRAFNQKKKYAQERKELIKEARKYVSMLDKDKVEKIDGHFRRKLFNYPGDITLSRIHTFFSKINIKEMKVEGIIDRL